MPTNANTFNSRVTSEALEAKFRQVFPAQGGAELVQDLFASGVIQPVVDFSTVAEGSVLAPNLQTAWDYSTTLVQINTATPTTIINNSGFWLVDFTLGFRSATTGAGTLDAALFINDGASRKPIWQANMSINATNVFTSFLEETKVVFLRAGDSLEGKCQNANYYLNASYRQIADVNGNLVNPLGFTFS